MRAAGAAAALVVAVWGCRAAEPTAPGSATPPAAEIATTDPAEPMPPITAAPVRLLRRDQLTPAEIKYGRAPRPDPSVVYTADVVIVEGGPDAIRGLSPDHLLWTIDPDAPGASRLKVGAIAFVTGRCVGRVLGMTRSAAGLTLLLGPVELTDIYERLEMRVDHQPIDFGALIEQPPPERPIWSEPGERQVDPFSDWNLDRAVQPGGVRPISDQVVSPGIPQGVAVGTHTEPIVPKDGPGVTMKVDKHGARLAAQMQFRLESPTFEFSLKIWKKEVHVIAILHNAAALRMAFDAAVSDQFQHNYHWRAEGPSLVIPFDSPAPFSVVVRQHFEVTTAFSSRTSSFGAGGTYELNADLGVSYDPTGGWKVHGPKGLVVVEPLLANMTGVSFGPSGMVLRHELMISAGLGAAGFTVGPQFYIQTALGVAQGSTIGIVQCREGAIGMYARATVGYTIPRLVEELVNFFLSLFNATPIRGYGSVKTPWRALFAPIRVTPGGQTCVKETGPAA